MNKNYVHIKKEQLNNRKIYVSDKILFTYNYRLNEYSDIKIKEPINKKILFIGFLNNSVHGNRTKTLIKLFEEDVKTKIKVISNGINLLNNIKNKSIELSNETVYGKKYIETLNSHLAYLFIGKGNSINKYINKTIYDCIIAKTPVVIYRKCDENHLIFKSDEFYFNDINELNIIIDKLKDNNIRTRWITEQRMDIEFKLNTLFEPLFAFSEYCKEKEEIQLNKLF
jgi:hypothetical protein